MSTAFEHLFEHFLLAAPALLGPFIVVPIVKSEQKVDVVISTPAARQNENSFVTTNWVVTLASLEQHSKNVRWCVCVTLRSLRHFYSRSFTTTNQQELAPGDRQCKVAWSFKKQQDRLAGWGGGPSYPRHHKAAGALIYGQLRKIDMDRRSCLQPIAKIHPKNRQYATVSGPPAAQNYSPAYQFAWPAKNHLQRILKKPIFSNIWSVKSKHLSKFSIGILERFWRLSLHSTVIPRYRCPKPFQNRSMYWKGVASKIYDGPSNIAEKKLAPSPHMIWLTFCLTCNFSICSKMFTSLAACIISKVI